MKRILLTGLSVAAFFAASAQTAVTGTQTDATTGFPYLGVDFAQDDFADGRSYGLETGGVFWWPDTTESKPADANGSIYEARRDSVPNGMQYTVTNEVKRYEPVGVGFGGSEADPIYINLTNDATLTVEVENKSATAVRFRAALQDVAGNLIDTKNATANATTPWLGEIYVDIPAGETATLTITDTQAKAGGEAKYGCADCPKIETDFMYDKVKGVNFTVVSTDQENMGITDAVVVIRNFKLGAIPAVVPSVLAPTNLSATDGPDGVTLSWTDESDNEESFIVYRKLIGEADFSPLITLDADVTTHLDAKAGLTLGQEYVYQVVSKLGTDEEPSNEAMVTPVGFGDDIVKLKANIYPNPATSTLNFSEELEGIVIYNSKGMVMFSAAKAKSVNVAEFSKGIYYLQTAKGSKSFVVE